MSLTVGVDDDVPDDTVVRRKVRTPGFLLQLENPDRLVVTIRKLQTYGKLPISGNG